MFLVMIFSILLTIVGMSTAVVFQQPLVWHKPKVIEIIEQGQYAAYVAYRNALRSSSLISIGQQVLDYGDRVYVGNITIGTPDQQFSVVVDTGSQFYGFLDVTATGVVAVQMLVAGLSHTCDTKHEFEPHLSSTFVKSSKQWSVKYKSGEAYGILGTDVMKFGGLHEPQLAVPNTTFGLANHISSEFEETLNDGILGLSFSPSSVKNIESPLINAINQNLLDQPLFTVWLQHQGALQGKPGGLFTYGAIDIKNCGPVITYEPLSSGAYYHFKISAIGIGNYTHQKVCEAVPDTGTSYIGGPKAIIDQLANAVGAVYNVTEEFYKIECDATPPTLDITIGTNKYSISSVNYIVKESFTSFFSTTGANNCFLSFVPSEFGGFGQDWILGVPFFYQFCSIFDIGQMRIGFAPSLHN